MSSTSSEGGAGGDVFGEPEGAARERRARDGLRPLQRATDDHLCELIEKRDPYAGYELLRRYYPCVVLPEALRVLADLADAEEVRSDLLLKLLRGPTDLAWEWPPSNVREWLKTVTFRLALDLKRSRDSELSRRAKQSEWLPACRLPDDLAARKELQESLAAAVRDLPVEEREAVEYLVLRDLPVRDTCEILDSSRRTLLRRRAAGLARLRKKVHLKKGYSPL